MWAVRKVTNISQTPSLFNQIITICKLRRQLAILWSTHSHRNSTTAVKNSTCVEISLTKTNRCPALKRSRGQRVKKRPKNPNTWLNRRIGVSTPVIGWSKCMLFSYMRLLVKGHLRDFQSIPDNTVNRYSIKEGWLNYKVYVLFWKKSASWMRFKTKLYSFPWSSE